jgi:hypothetical protein
VLVSYGGKDKKMRTKPVSWQQHHSGGSFANHDALDSVQVVKDDDKYIVIPEVYNADAEYDNMSYPVISAYDNLDEANLQASLMGDMLGCTCYVLENGF